MQQQEEKFRATGGKFKNYKVSDLFNIYSPTKRFNANAIKFGGKYPYVVRTSQNNGIRGYITEDEKYLSPANTFSFGQDTATVFYQDKPYFTGDKIKVMKLKIGNLNKERACYLLSIIRKAFSNFSWGQTSFNENVLNNVEIIIPTKNNQIDFDYMEERIRVLEEERIRVLESYLKVSGLTDCNLTRDEEKILYNIKYGNIKFKEFKLEDILNWQPQKEIDPLKIKELTVIGKNKYPFYGQATINNGIISYECLKSEVLNNTLSSPTILIHSNNQNCVYLETPFYLKDGHGATSVLQNKNLNELNAQFLISCIKKVIIARFSYDEKATKIALKNTYIQLPVSDNNQIDYAFMETYIRAIEKKVIKNVIDWKNTIIEKTKEIIA